MWWGEERDMWLGVWGGWGVGHDVVDGVSEPEGGDVGDDVASHDEGHHGEDEV